MAAAVGGSMGMSRHGTVNGFFANRRPEKRRRPDTD
jgi:hypothetical protein